MKMTINRNLIVNMRENEKYLFIKMMDKSIYQCPAIIQIEMRKYCEEIIGERFEHTNYRANHKAWDLIDYDLLFYITENKNNFIELPEETIIIGEVK